MENPNLFKWNTIELVQIERNWYRYPIITSSRGVAVVVVWMCRLILFSFEGMMSSYNLYSFELVESAFVLNELVLCKDFMATMCFRRVMISVFYVLRLWLCAKQFWLNCKCFSVCNLVSCQVLSIKYLGLFWLCGVTNTYFFYL